MSDYSDLVTDYVRRVLWDQTRHQDRVLRKCITDAGRDWPWHLYVVEVIPGANHALIYPADQPIPALPGWLPFERRIFAITPEAVEVAFRTSEPITATPAKPPQKPAEAPAPPPVGDGIPETVLSDLSGPESRPDRRPPCEHCGKPTSLSCNGCGRSLCAPHAARNLQTMIHITGLPCDKNAPPGTPEPCAHCRHVPAAHHAGGICIQCPAQRCLGRTQ